MAEEVEEALLAGVEAHGRRKRDSTAAWAKYGSSDRTAKQGRRLGSKQRLLWNFGRW
jgi:hypothetical protein